MPHYLDIIHAANNANPHDYQRLYINNEPIGFVNKTQRELLNSYRFRLSPQKKHFKWADANRSMAENTQYLKPICQKLYTDNILEAWRDEAFALAINYQHQPQALVERAAIPLFGACGYGIHVNGLTLKSKQIYMWISQRAKNKSVDPNKYDQIAAGGTPWGMLSFDNMQKESQEEAGIPYALSQQARPVGISSYCHEVSYGIRADVMFNYDLWLPETFVPKNTDGEAQAFYLLPLTEIPDLLLKDDQVKFNSAIVMIDCLIRYGIINEKTADYEQICASINYRNQWINQIHQ